jgi:hypothetical protein
VDVPVPATVALVGMTWRFNKPVRIGESIAAHWRLNRKRDVENPQWGLVTWQVDVIGGDGEVRAQGEVSRLVARKAFLPVNGEQPAGAKRRRRGRRSSSAAGTASAPAPAPEVPEPAPADTPSPARRRRRGRRGGGGGNGAAAVETPPPAEPEPAQPPPSPAVAVDASPPSGEESPIGSVLKRIRRRRS